MFPGLGCEHTLRGGGASSSLLCSVNGSCDGGEDDDSVSDGTKQT